MISFTIQFRICWIALGIDRFDAFDQVAECGPPASTARAGCAALLRHIEKFDSPPRTRGAYLIAQTDGQIFRTRD